MNANGASPTTDAAPAGSITTDWSEILDYTAAIWAQRLAETVAEAARWRAVAVATQRALDELGARVATLEGAPDATAASR